MRILTISDSPNIFSGLARVHRNVIDAFVEDGHQILPCVWYGYDSDTSQKIKRKEIKPPPLTYKSTAGNVQMLDLPRRRNFDEMKQLYEIILLAKPDVICTIGDYWDFFYMQSLKMKTDYSFKWLAYLTIEADEIDPKLLPLFRYADALAVPTNYGRQVLESEVGRQVEVIPYGVDAKFARMTDAQRYGLRQQRDCEDKVRFITVAQNTWRKNLPTLMQAVRLICHRDPQKRMQFYVHSNVDADASQEASFYDLKSIAKKLGVEDWFVFPEECSIFDSPNDALLVDEYNSADFFVTPSTCEGFGLPIVEAMACGLPVIANAASCMPDHVGQPLSGGNFGHTNRGWMVGNRLEIFPPDKQIKIIRHDALGQVIWEAGQWLSDPNRRETLTQMRQNCVEYAKERTWANMKRGICKVLESISGPVSIPVEVVE